MNSDNNNFNNNNNFSNSNLNNNQIIGKRKRKLTSSIWNIGYFSILPGGKKVHCAICNTALNNNTSTLKYHQQHLHPNISTTEEAESNSTTLVKLLISAKLSFSIVENVYFKKLCGFNISADVVKGYIDEYFILEFNKILNVITTAETPISVAIDIWTSKQGDSYLGIFYH